MDKKPGYIEMQQVDQAQRIASLHVAYLFGCISVREHDELDKWVRRSDENMELFEDLTNEQKMRSRLNWMRQTNLTTILKRLKNKLAFRPDAPDKNGNMFKKTLAVVSFLLLSFATDGFSAANENLSTLQNPALKKFELYTNNVTFISGALSAF